MFMAALNMEGWAGYWLRGTVLTKHEGPRAAGFFSYGLDGHGGDGNGWILLCTG